MNLSAAGSCDTQPGCPFRSEGHTLPAARSAAGGQPPSVNPSQELVWLKRVTLPKFVPFPKKSTFNEGPDGKLRRSDPLSPNHNNPDG